MELPDTPETRGMIHKVRHLVTVQRVERRWIWTISSRPHGSKHSKKRVGRGHGTGQGTQAGRGHKGAKSRSGYKFKRGFEGGQMPLHRRIPKRGFHNPFRVEYAVVNLDTLAERFDAGTMVTPELLRASGLVRGARLPIKVLARGDMSKKLTRARAQVQRQGGGEARRGRRRRPRCWRRRKP